MSSDEQTIAAQAGDPERIERFVILRRLGPGGAGTVFAAYDPTLDRRVAIKLLRTSPGDGPARAAVLHEAQAMARLDHPNVVGVHEVGERGDDVYIAMDYVEGVTVREWLRERPRRREEILAVFRAAGEGLLAAHRAHLVHRDFKPENVLVDRRGRVRVADFGLAQATGRLTASTALEELRRPEDARPTPQGSWDGTPAYMAPEQFEGAEVDERTDQFAFCVALFEALTGARPARGAQGEIEIPAAPRVPRRLRRALLRGLSTDRAQRHRSMSDLLAVLAVERRRHWQVVALAGAVTCAALIATLASRADDAAASMCANHRTLFAGAWDDEQRERVRARLTAGGSAREEDAWVRVEAALDAYAEDWAVDSQSSCIATRVHATQSVRALDLRTSCLDRRKREIAALVAELAGETPVAPERALDAVFALPSIDGCADVERLGSIAPPPDQPEALAAYETAVARLTEAKALDATGRRAPARELAEKALAAALESGHAGIVAEVRGLIVDLARNTGDPRALAEAWAYTAAAIAAHDRRGEAAAWLDLTLLLHEAGKLDDAEGCHALASATLERIGNPTNMLSQLHYIGSVIAISRGHYDEAVEATGKAVALLENDARYRASLSQVTYGFAVALQNAGRFAEALEWSRRAEHDATSVFGPFHFNAIMSRRAAADALDRLGRHQEALEIYGTVLADAEATLGSESTSVGALHVNRMGPLLMLGRPVEALASADRALAIFMKTLGAEHPFVLSVRHNRAEVMRQNSRAVEALTEFEALHATRVRTQGERHPETIDELQRIGASLAELGRIDEALEVLERAVTLGAAARGEDHPTQAVYLADVAQTALKAKDPRLAERTAAQAVRIFEASHAPDSQELVHALRLHADALDQLQRREQGRAVRARADALAPG